MKGVATIRGSKNERGSNYHVQIPVAVHQQRVGVRRPLENVPERMTMGYRFRQVVKPFTGAARPAPRMLVPVTGLWHQRLRQCHRGAWIMLEPPCGTVSKRDGERVHPLLHLGHNAAAYPCDVCLVILKGLLRLLLDAANNRSTGVEWNASGRSNRSRVATMFVANKPGIGHMTC